MTRDEMMNKQTQVTSLMASLSASTSDIGDWKIAKCMEYINMGKESPYSLSELHERRQAVRDEINALQEELDNAVLEDDTVGRP